MLNQSFVFPPPNPPSRSPSPIPTSTSDTHLVLSSHHANSIFTTTSTKTDGADATTSKPRPMKPFILRSTSPRPTASSWSRSPSFSHGAGPSSLRTSPSPPPLSATHTAHIPITPAILSSPSAHTSSGNSNNNNRDQPTTIRSHPKGQPGSISISFGGNHSHPHPTASAHPRHAIATSNTVPAFPPSVSSSNPITDDKTGKATTTATASGATRARQVEQSKLEMKRAALAARRASTSIHALSTPPASGSGHERRPSSWLIVEDNPSPPFGTIPLPSTSTATRHFDQQQPRGRTTIPVGGRAGGPGSGGLNVRKKPSLGDATNRHLPAAPDVAPGPSSSAMRTPERSSSTNSKGGVVPVGDRGKRVASASPDKKRRMPSTVRGGSRKHGARGENHKSLLSGNDGPAEYSSMQELLENSGFVETRIITPLRPIPVPHFLDPERSLYNKIRLASASSAHPPKASSPYPPRESPNRPALKAKPSLLSLALNSLWPSSAAAATVGKTERSTTRMRTEQQQEAESDRHSVEEQRREVGPEEIYAASVKNERARLWVDQVARESGVSPPDFIYASGPRGRARPVGSRVVGCGGGGGAAVTEPFVQLETAVGGIVSASPAITAYEGKFSSPPSTSSTCTVVPTRRTLRYSLSSPALIPSSSSTIRAPALPTSSHFSHHTADYRSDASSQLSSSPPAIQYDDLPEIPDSPKNTIRATLRFATPPRRSPSFSQNDYHLAIPLSSERRVSKKLPPAYEGLRGTHPLLRGSWSRSLLNLGLAAASSPSSSSLTPGDTTKTLRHSASTGLLGAGGRGWKFALFGGFGGGGVGKSEPAAEKKKEFKEMPELLRKGSKILRKGQALEPRLEI